ncbi:MAG TPA: hypothetical protein VD866_05065 [Urbifossiella sp.]|nr:hypothetical protein [Urbifossiella sp.]
MIGRLALLAVAALLGYAVGWVAGLFGHTYSRPASYPFLAERVPLPHHVPPVKGGAALRFAMVHDILHERYPRHGTAYHAERVRVTRAKLAALPPDDPAAFALTDDLAVALDRLGRGDEAALLLEDKLRRQLAAKRPERELYTTYANLGTILSQGAFGRGAEGLALVRKSVEVNPTAHFGRGKWQAQFDDYRLSGAAAAGRFDAIGNPLSLTVQEALDREMNWVTSGLGRPTDPDFGKGREFDTAPAFFEPGTDPADPARWEELRPIRDHITRVGPTGENGRDTVPFDEPVVAIVGLWRQVRGPAAHLALVLGETMLRVGQRHLAWAAFERARRVAAPGGSPAFHDHCRARQADLEQTFTNAAEWTRRSSWLSANPPLTAEEVAALRPRFEAELAHGEAYQRAYQEHEERQIAAGVPLDDPQFYAAFHAGREPIATPVGPEEWHLWVPPARMHEYTAARRRSWGTVGAGLAALLAAALIRRRASARGSRR